MFYKSFKMASLKISICENAENTIINNLTVYNCNGQEFIGSWKLSFVNLHRVMPRKELNI